MMNKALRFVLIALMAVWTTACSVDSMDSAVEGEQHSGSLATGDSSAEEEDGSPVDEEELDDNSDNDRKERRSSVARVAKPNWREVGLFKGKKSQKTKAFKVSGKEWKVEWNVKGPSRDESEFIIILVNNEDPEDQEILTTQVEGGSGFQVFEGGDGKYDLDISSDRNYEVKISEYK